MNTDAILARIGDHGALEPCLSVLARLQRAFLFSVPFENCDIHWGRPISLDPQAFYRKIVEEGRGGFCYESNGLFAELLRALGFEVELLEAQMHSAEGFGGPFDHLVLLVRLEEDFLVDVGNGQSFHSPLALRGGAIAEAEGIHYRVGPWEDRQGLWFQKPGEDWRIRFRFRTRPRELNDFAGMCHHHQSAPGSFFRRGIFATRPIPGGRLCLSFRGLSCVEEGVESLESFADEAALEASLALHFGIRRGS